MGKFWRKVLLNGIVVVPLLMWFTEATLLGSLVTAVVLSAIAWLLCDQLILRVTNNTIATLADAVLAFAYLWAVAAFADWSLSMGELLIIVALLGVVEFFFHGYLEREDGNNRNTGGVQS
ncbi:DUF2512 family protein [Brevibacillus dissolubilis]|uniref:DUF2512 family protein n=1 Tax=Brevibacillus dissolubilis TaxID=1844116 RepID=UPI001115BEB6|nr:DUF2512 family protein [Brevibacillus dissolubilis]